MAFVFQKRTTSDVGESSSEDEAQAVIETAAAAAAELRGTVRAQWGVLSRIDPSAPANLVDRTLFCGEEATRYGAGGGWF